MNIEEKFERGRQNHTYQRIDPDYLTDIFLGYNDQGQMSLVVREYGKIVAVTSSKLISVQMTSKEGRVSLAFDLQDERYRSPFIIFCKDLITVCEKAGPSMAISSAIVRWKYWKEMFGRKGSDLLDKQSIKGLTGELIELRDHFIRDYGEKDAVSSWMGPLLGHKDFEIGDTWYEVKSISENALQVVISSLEQLDSDCDGHLVVVRLEDTSSVNVHAVTLNSVVLSIVNQISDPEVLELFRARLANMGYVWDEEYDNYCFSYKGTQRYIVNDEFPALTRGKVPSAIGNVKYTIMLEGISQFKES